MGCVSCQKYTIHWKKGEIKHCCLIPVPRDQTLCCLIPVPDGCSSTLTHVVCCWPSNRIQEWNPVYWRFLNGECWPKCTWREPYQESLGFPLNNQSSYFGCHGWAGHPELEILGASLSLEQKVSARWQTQQHSFAFAGCESLSVMHFCICNFR